MNENRIFETEDGSHSMFSEKHGVSYHSKYGAIQETQHVFIDAALHFRLSQSTSLTTSLSVLDIGFGTGLNAYMTFLESFTLDIPIHYTAIEAFPVSKDTSRQLNYPQLLNQPTSGFFQFHDCEWEVPHSFSEIFLFTKHYKTFESLDFQNQFDVIYFDAFAPNAQPELWEAPILEKMYNALQPGGVMTTYCAKGVVKRTLKKVGFVVEAIPGPPGKREMTRASKL